MGLLRHPRYHRGPGCPPHRRDRSPGVGPNRLGSDLRHLRAPRLRRPPSVASVDSDGPARSGVGSFAPRGHVGGAARIPRRELLQHAERRPPRTQRDGAERTSPGCSPPVVGRRGARLSGGILRHRPFRLGGGGAPPGPRARGRRRRRGSSGEQSGAAGPSDAPGRVLRLFRIRGQSGLQLPRGAGAGIPPRRPIGTPPFRGLRRSTHLAPATGHEPCPDLAGASRGHQGTRRASSRLDRLGLRRLAGGRAAARRRGTSL
jgi:hypothetical protein